MVAILLFALLLLETSTSLFHSSPRLHIPDYLFPLCKRSSTAPPLVNSITCVKKSFSPHSQRLLSCFHCPTYVLVTWNDDYSSSFPELTLFASYSWSGLQHPTPPGLWQESQPPLKFSVLHLLKQICLTQICWLCSFSAKSLSVCLSFLILQVSSSPCSSFPYNSVPEPEHSSHL